MACGGVAPKREIAKSFAALYIAHLGSAKLTGGAPGLQIRCGGVKAFPGGFDSHALPPSYKPYPFRWDFLGGQCAYSVHG